MLFNLFALGAYAGCWKDSDCPPGVSCWLSRSGNPGFCDNRRGVEDDFEARLERLVEVLETRLVRSSNDCKNGLDSCDTCINANSPCYWYNDECNTMEEAYAVFVKEGVDGETYKSMKSRVNADKLANGQYKCASNGQGRSIWDQARDARAIFESFAPMARGEDEDCASSTDCASCVKDCYWFNNGCKGAMTAMAAYYKNGGADWAKDNMVMIGGTCARHARFSEEKLPRGCCHLDTGLCCTSDCNWKCPS